MVPVVGEFLRSERLEKPNLLPAPRLGLIIQPPLKKIEIQVAFKIENKKRLRLQQRGFQFHFFFNV